MIDALMIGELERYAINDLNRPLTQTDTETLDKVIEKRFRIFASSFFYFINISNFRRINYYASY